MSETFHINVEGDIVHLKKNFNEWRVVHPVIIDGKINWNNLLFGGKENFIKLIIIILLLSFLIYSYIHDVSELTEVANNPCKYYMGVSDVYSEHIYGVEDINYGKIENWTFVSKPS